jgi:hypothetical protein
MHRTVIRLEIHHGYHKTPDLRYTVMSEKYLKKNKNEKAKICINSFFSLIRAFFINLMNDFYFFKDHVFIFLSFHCIYKKVEILTYLALITILLFCRCFKTDPPGKVVCVVRAETLICSVGDAADS